jgi:spore coat polysaccharide biosynthesis predicted glycosyltransferase SpsG
MMKADLALGAGGTTTSERLCMGVPSLVIGIAKNQILSCNSLHSLGLINYLGYMAEVGVDQFTKEIIRMIASPKLLVEASLTGQALVDGSGVDMINKILGTK